MAVNDSTRLGCGRDIDQVWANVTRPPDPHEQTCPDCTAARASLAELVRVTSQLHQDDDLDDDLQVSPLVLTRILDIARSEVRRGRRLPLSRPRPGEVSVELSVSEQAVAAVVRRACDLDPTIHLRRCSVELVTADPEDTDAPEDTDGRDDVDPGPSQVRLSLRLSVADSVAIPQAASALRTELARIVNQEVGMVVVTVDIVVEDVHRV